MCRKLILAGLVAGLVLVVGNLKARPGLYFVFSPRAAASGVELNHDRSETNDADYEEAFGPEYGCAMYPFAASSPGRTVGAPVGGDIPPLRTILDPYPSFNGVALDVENNRVVFSDTNRKSLLTYDRAAGTSSKEVTKPIRQLFGPDTGIGFIAGVAVDSAHREAFAVNNDIEDRMVAFSYDAEGNSKPERVLYVPHQAWGVSLSKVRDELAISVQAPNMLVFYRRTARGLEAPVRKVRGPHTGMADPHGVRFDDANNEIVVANHGNWRQDELVTAYTAYDDPNNARPARAGGEEAKPAGGEFRPSSVTVYSATASGDAAPLRTIQGSRTQLDWPMGLDVDTANNEIAVANNGNNSISVYRRTDNGDAVPIRVIRGSHTGINNPMAVAIDVKNDELWVANFGDHSALVFSRTARGDATPKRIIWNAPPGSPTGGFGNPYCAAYDPN